MLKLPDQHKEVQISFQKHEIDIFIRVCPFPVQFISKCIQYTANFHHSGGQKHKQKMFGFEISTRWRCWIATRSIKHEPLRAVSLKITFNLSPCRIMIFGFIYHHSKYFSIINQSRHVSEGLYKDVTVNRVHLAELGSLFRAAAPPAPQSGVINRDLLDVFIWLLLLYF